MCTTLPSPIRPTCHANLIRLDFTTRTILGKEYRSLSSSLHTPILATTFDGRFSIVSIPNSKDKRATILIARLTHEDYCISTHNTVRQISTKPSSRAVRHGHFALLTRASTLNNDLQFILGVRGTESRFGARKPSQFKPTATRWRRLTQFRRRQFHVTLLMFLRDIQDYRLRFLF